MWAFYISKGFIGAKIKAEQDVKKNKKYILQKQQELENMKIIPDTELIKSFPDKIFVPKNVSGGLGSLIFNSLLSSISKKAKSRILH